LLKKKNVDITYPRKQLKLLATEDSQTKEVSETEIHKEEMLKLIMEHVITLEFPRMRRKLAGVTKKLL
jgi:hypothetical protein